MDDNDNDGMDIIGHDSRDDNDCMDPNVNFSIEDSNDGKNNSINDKDVVDDNGKHSNKSIDALVSPFKVSMKDHFRIRCTGELMS